MPRVKDLNGRVFGRLTVTGLNHVARYAMWNCRCNCGGNKVVASFQLLAGSTKSCGCLQPEVVSKLSTKHGDSKRRPEYNVWSSMLRRCSNPKNPAYADYGGRGITVCDEWKSYENFIRDMGYRPSDKHSIDRIENGLGYSKGNCRWATRAEQNRNYRRNRWIETPLGRMLLCDAAEKSGIDAVTLRSRLRRGWPPERLFDPLKINQSDAVRAS